MYNLTNYHPPSTDNWSGRNSKLREYWHQHIQLLNIEKDILQDNSISIIGYACDEGVKRNQGRVGAADGPVAIRKLMGPMAWHHGGKTIHDCGDITCPSGQMEVAQEDLSKSVAKILSHNSLPIVLGGGHDLAYGTFMGIHQFLKDTAPKRRIGIINFDAHYDLRSVDDHGTSGTPFTQIAKDLEASNSEFRYMCLGIQLAANPKSLVEHANERKVVTLLASDMSLDKLSGIQDQLSQFLEPFDDVYVTIDLDGFSSAIAPGVSAPSPLGFLPEVVFPCLSQIMASQKLIALDIAEMNPQYDVDNSTARLASRIVDKVVGKIFKKN